MHALVMCIAAAAVGIDVGWQRTPTEGMEYIIQLDPQTLEALRSGEAIASDIPPRAGNVRSFRIIVGTKALPQEAPPSPAPTPSAVKPTTAAPKGPQAAAAPETLSPDPRGKPIAERPANFVESQSPTTADKPHAASPSDVASKEPAKPWLPLTLTLLGLFASLGLNVFLGWIAWDFRQRLVPAKQAAT
jgi:hypothetical protein